MENNINDADFAMWLRIASENEKLDVLKSYTKAIEELTQQIVKIANRGQEISDSIKQK